MKIQTQKFFSETIFPQFVLVLTSFAYYPCFLSFLSYTCFIFRFSLRPSYVVQYSWTSVPGKAAYRRTEYGSGKSGKKDKDIVFVGSEKLNTTFKHVQVNLYFNHISLYQLYSITKIIIKIHLKVLCIKYLSDHIKYSPALFVCVCYLCLVFAASAFKRKYYMKYYE